MGNSAAAAVVRRLDERGETVAAAESLTGGLVAATIVEIPGASAVFRGGLVAYATDLKHTLAGVPEELLAERGPV
ncbi:MAG TPA: CinA family protein, partial [Actinoplanes sp.]|nr:CinA family protein [Actinoplanes sp.]